METVRIKLNLKTNKPLDEYVATEQINNAVKKLVELGSFKGKPSDILLNYDIILGPTNYAVLDLRKDAYVDGADLASIGAEKVSNEELPKGNSVLEATKSYSQATLNERLRLSGLDPRQRCRYVVMDYKRYYTGHKDKLLENTDQLRMLRDLFLNDFMAMFTQVSPLIEDGKQLNALLGLQVIAPDISKSAREFSLAYKRAAQSEKSTGAPSPAMYKVLVAKYRAFIDALLPSIFPGIENVQVKKGKDIKENSVQTETQDTTNDIKTESKKYSFVEDGRINLFE